MSSFENCRFNLEHMKEDAEKLQRADDERSGEGKNISDRISSGFGKMNEQIIESTHSHLKTKNTLNEKDE